MGVRRIVVGMAMGAAVMVPAAPALAQYGGSLPSSTTSTTELPEETTTTTEEAVVAPTVVTQAPPPAPAPAPTVRGNVLARTGADILQGVVIGGALIGAGAIAVAGTRRRRAAA